MKNNDLHLLSFSNIRGKYNGMEPHSVFELNLIEYSKNSMF